ncbi:uncharacterized protein LOC118647008 [Monomorium pharaonis]|uniref:uncharacterized protein LOC118647008 n=1 Tax=Monomorium pharaonis TaxID=307658 RepID=UPI0017474019|nr:uncharacterized protein LOC118647008 [Monomorium pharaonis]
MKLLKSNVSSEKRRLVEELYALARKNFPRRHVIVRGYDDLWQADIVEIIPYSRFNKGYHYILTVIDVLSKYAWTIPLKSKSGSETADAIAEIIRESGRRPKNLQTDMGKEFYNADVQKLLQKHDINHYSTYSHYKVVGPAKFKVGDSVRVSKYKIIFEKGYTPNWTTEVFKIVKVQRTNPVTYLLEDYRGTSIAGAFYEHELHRATHPDVFLVEKVLRRKGNEVYVKWLGFDGSHNSWIHKDNVI